MKRLDPLSGKFGTHLLLLAAVVGALMLFSVYLDYLTVQYGFGFGFLSWRVSYAFFTESLGIVLMMYASMKLSMRKFAIVTGVGFVSIIAFEFTFPALVLAFWHSVFG